MNVEIFKGDITKINVDAIVNAANVHLIPGGGVDGSIHRAAGPQLAEECKALGGCKVGEAKLTQPYGINVKGIIHTVGPTWFGGQSDEDKNLENAYRNSLMLAVESGFKTVAFPCISTGVYNYPKDRAVEIAFRVVGEFLKENEAIEKVVFCCFTDADYEIYNNKMKELVMSKEKKRFVPYY